MPDPNMPDGYQAGDFSLEERPGCLSGLLKLFFLRTIYNWLQRNVGFGRGCFGTGCGIIFFAVAALFFCSIIFGTNWFDFGF